MIHNIFLKLKKTFTLFCFFKWSIFHAANLSERQHTADTRRSNFKQQLNLKIWSVRW